MTKRKAATQPARPTWQELADTFGPQRPRRTVSTPGISRGESTSHACDKCKAHGNKDNLVVLFTNGKAICQRCRKAKR